jgi:hypothetical protein
VNAVVFDAKDVTGIVNYNSRVPEVLDLGTSEKRSIDDIDKLIRALKRKLYTVIARVALFRDHLLAKKIVFIRHPVAVARRNLEPSG